MRGLVLESVERFALVDLAVPRPGPQDMLVRVESSGICGSELGGFRGTDGLRRPGLVFGHELVGRVAEYGRGVAPEARLPVGTLVTANPFRTCGRCRLCRLGQRHLCPDRQLLGGHVHGSNAEYVVVPAAAALTVDRGAGPSVAVFTEPAACSLRAVRRSGAGPGDSALVIGAGPVGLLLIEVLGLHGVGPVHFAETVEGRVAPAEASGGDRVPSEPAALLDAVRGRTEGLGVDVVFDAVGTQQTRESATAAVRPGGTVVFVGLHSADGTLPLRDLIRREIACLTSFAYTEKDFVQTLDLLLDAKICFRGQVVSADLADGQRWYEELAAGSPVGKVLLRPGTAASSAQDRPPSVTR